MGRIRPAASGTRRDFERALEGGEVTSRRLDDARAAIGESVDTGQVPSIEVGNAAGSVRSRSTSTRSSFSSRWPSTKGSVTAPGVRVARAGVA
jgi:hypothetical protein